MHRLILPFLLLVSTLNAASLRPDFEIGRVADFQGVGAVRPPLALRWTPVQKGLGVNAGDWLRTDVRGANAVLVRLADGGQLVLGPGTLVEFGKDGAFKLVNGELVVDPGKGGEVKLKYGGKMEVVKARGVYRWSEAKVHTGLLRQDPDWLLGFKGAVTTESMGKLVAKVDGRDTPLTIGYHKVSVDIRDQIARTTIEESFVNHTDRRMEGVFYFPLPQDASIAGFGMWINGELVEADVVEKQRAREIYETILRERRDPGLLEWTGGNIFKARVFPIFAHSEKRIKITYTQVLPMRDGKYLYHYALQSEMLQLNPLRELLLDVRVSSTKPIKNVTCKTHDARLSKTSYSAQVEFAAKEYTPKSDFEVVVEADPDSSPVTMIPHQRGDDGYFLALVTPPNDSGGWERELVGDGEPLDLLILADTSGSMDATARQKQDAFLAGLLGALGEKDTFNIAACDVDANFFSEEPVAASEKEVWKALEFLAKRDSLGWSDLEGAFSSAMKRAGKGTHVVYIGDGVATTPGSNPEALAKRLVQMYKIQGSVGTFHAVAPGSTFETPVLKAVASLGGGSMRQMGTSNPPVQAALQLLLEMTRPGLRDMDIIFEGMRTARVYPESIPNLQAGTQQIVVGRYLPEGDTQTGKLRVSGVLDGKAQKFSAEVSLANAEDGNSFIPRLWARMHLDYLLQQGRSQAIKEDIIALSEEFHIMTPYTSFLVLESDEDRRRFGVKRRFRMRDGEKFFAEGRDSATLQLL